jgi:hypothetical protein
MQIYKYCIHPMSFELIERFPETHRSCGAVRDKREQKRTKENKREQKRTKENKREQKRTKENKRE